MASGRIGNGGAGSSRSVNDFKSSSSLVDWLSREMLEMRLQGKVDHEDMDSESDVSDGVAAEMGHVIRTTVGSRNGQSRQAVSYIGEHVIGTGSFGVVFSKYSDVSAYRLSLSEDTKTLNQLNTLIQEGKEMASVIYTYRSCVKALPQVTPPSPLKLVHELLENLSGYIVWFDKRL